MLPSCAPMQRMPSWLQALLLLLRALMQHSPDIHSSPHTLAAAKTITHR
jgi:hypothetical protein